MKKLSNFLSKLPHTYIFAGCMVLMAAIAAYICFFHLGKAPLSDWDEAWYGEMTKEILRTKQFIVLQWNRDFLFDKPPLYIWITAMLSFLFGLSEFTIRLTSAVCGWLTMILVAYYAYKKWGIVPAFLAFFTVSLNDIFIWRTRSGNLDALVTFLIFMTYLVILSKHKYKYIILGILFGLIYLTKASLVAFPFVIFLMYEGLYNRHDWKKHLKEYLKLIGVAGVLVGGWLLLGYFQAGSRFITYYLFKSDQNVSHVDPFHFKFDYWQYAYYSLQRRFLYLFFLGLFFLIIHIKKGQQFLLFSFSLFLLLLLSFTERNNNWYLMPSMPFWSLTIAYGIYELTQLKFIYKYRYLLIIPLILVSSYIFFKTFKVNITPMLVASSTTDSVETAKKVNMLSQKNDIVVRLDHLYPSTIYYADRKVFSSPSDASTSDLFISRDDLKTAVEQGRVHWIVGTKSDVEDVIKKYQIKGEIIPVNNDEEILHIK